MWRGRSTFDFLLGSEDMVHNILIVVGRVGVHVQVLVLGGWVDVVAIGVGVVGIGHSKDSTFLQ
jgi:hypothetical protein